MPAVRFFSINVTPYSRDLNENSSDKVTPKAFAMVAMNHQGVAVLKNKSAERYLPVYIGSSQADAIKRELTDVKPSVPIANDPISKDIKTIGSRISSVKIDNFKDNKFSAKLVLAVLCFTGSRTAASGKSHKVNYPVAKATG